MIRLRAIALEVAGAALASKAVVHSQGFQKGGFPVPFSPAKKQIRDLNPNSVSLRMGGTVNG